VYNSEILLQPVKKDRIDVLDGLRGFAVFGIFVINIRLFSGYALIPEESRLDMMFTQWDEIFNWIHIVFFSAKFYTLFSLLFGIGFAIQLIRATKKNQSFLPFFSRRLFFLFLIGLIHLWMIWYSDILVFYALCGFLLIPFRKISNPGLLWIAFLFLVLTALHTLYIYNSGGGYANFFYQKLSEGWVEYGLPRAPSEYDTFRMPDIAEVIRSESWNAVFRFNLLGPWLRLYLISYDARVLKILAIFLIGFWFGRKIISSKLHENKKLLVKMALVGWCIGLPVNILFVEGDAEIFNNSTQIVTEDLITSIGYISLSIAYAASFFILYLTNIKKLLIFLFNPVGKMALSNYLFQSVVGIMLFYSAGFGLGEYFGSTLLTIAVLIIFGFQVVASRIWLNYYRFGPAEWLWRVLTYGRYMNLRIQNPSESLVPDHSSIKTETE
jgi:uncharacterized protein